MDNYIIDLKTDLLRTEIKPVNLGILALPGDNQAHTFRVAVFNGDEPASLDGASCFLYVKLFDRQVFQIAGTVSGNTARFTLEEACYSVGGFTHAIARLNNGTQRVTIADLTWETHEDMTRDASIPRKYQPTIEDLEGYIERLDALEKWLSAYDSDLMLNAFDILKEMRKTDTTSGGITFTWSGDRCRVTGTRSSTAFCNLYNNTKSMPDRIKAGDTIYVSFESTSQSIYLQAFFYTASGSSTSAYITETSYVSVPSGTVGMIIRILVDSNLSGKQIDETIGAISFTNAPSNERLNVMIDESFQNGLYTDQEYLPSCNLDSLVETKSFMLIDSNVYENAPFDNKSGVLNVYRYNRLIFQEFVLLSKKEQYKRWRRANGVWSEWILVNPDSEQNVYNVSQTFNEFHNTYTVSSSPTINPNSDYVLNSTGDTTDRTYDIITLLNTVGICRLGSGIFFVSGVDMPNDTMLIGSGTRTKLILIGDDTTEGYAIKMGSRCTIQDMAITGNLNDYTGASSSNEYPKDADYVNRHGILWQGNASGSNNSIPRRGIISRCYISNFSGGGITCYDSGLNTISGMNVSDCWIWHCYAGINIQFYSEFSRWTNISCNYCHYGAINNGGNQTFANCGFSKNTVGMLIDNSANQSTNNSHGSVSNCVFDHSDNNIGVGIKLLGITNGELFSNIQLFYSSIEIDKCKGVSLTNFDFGRSADTQSGKITISNGSFVIMDKFMCREVPRITVDETSKLAMSDCYTWTGEIIRIS